MNKTEIIKDLGLKLTMEDNIEGFIEIHIEYMKNIINTTQVQLIMKLIETFGLERNNICRTLVEIQCLPKDEK